MLFTCQVTAVFVVLRTVAVKRVVLLRRTVAEEGDTVTVTAPFTVMLNAAEVCPSGFATVIATVPAALAEPLAVNCAAETNVVESDELPNFTTAPLWKPLPFTVRVKLPAVSGLGLTEEIAGATFRIVTEADPVAAGVATVVACTVTVAGDGTAPGAV